MFGACALMMMVCVPFVGPCLPHVVTGGKEYGIELPGQALPIRGVH